ncbi:winged helix-turn-helix transcriptional regulator [Candidatus Micrarchaeota archaeon]|nr:winged helix-turn-helix transcriptional regulator [Candidatus Micrarchaeota archaeon]MBU1930593.1 winged helix-turn-helix transcriptional regulator [Candidatus Micrarchaeota archaeon]
MRFDENQPLELDTRKKLYTIIEKSPGLHFREIQRRSGIAVGSLQYHLDYLQKRGFLTLQKEGKFVRYYAMRTRKIIEDKGIMALLRQEQPRHILLFLLQRRFATNERIAQAVNLSQSTTSAYLKKMLETSALQRKKRSRKTHFFISDKEKIVQLLAKYKKSFLDELVDNFVEVWNEVGK